LAKSRNFISLKHKKIKTIRYFIFFLNFDLAKGAAEPALRGSQGGQAPPFGGLAPAYF